MRVILKIAVVVLAVLISGCASERVQSVYDKETGPATSVVVKDAKVADAMEQSRLVLRGMGFKFDKFDTEAGYLRTEVLGASQVFEFWRDDNVGVYNTAMANINSIARVVEMNFKTADDGVHVDCTANVRQLSVRTGDIESVSDMKSAFTKSSGGFKRLSLRGEGAQWISLGRDVMLEDMVLFEIGKEPKS